MGKMARSREGEGKDRRREEERLDRELSRVPAGVCNLWEDKADHIHEILLKSLSRRR